MKRLIIQGSARSEGDSYQIVSYLKNLWNADVLDLKQKSIGHFDYDFQNKDDDFLPIIRKIASQYDFILFVTPVYWYSMSGHMKVFFDRLTDCLRLEKETGRKLRGKQMAVVSCTNDPIPVPHFDMPFRETASYLGMGYVGWTHAWVVNGKLPQESQKALETLITNWTT